jgi:hypothetical protein
VDNHLRARMDGAGPLLLAATSPTRFRVEGMGSQDTLTFQIAEGRATSLVLEQAGWPLTLTREGPPAAQAGKSGGDAEAKKVH